MGWNIFHLLCVFTFWHQVVHTFFLCLLHRLKGPKYKWGCLAFIWSIYILMASLGFHLHSHYILCIVLIPVLIIDSFCTRSILKSLRQPPPGDTNMRRRTTEVKEKRTPKMKGGEKGKRAEARRGDNAVKKKAFVTVAVVQAMLMINYTPFIFTLMLWGVLPDHTAKCQLLGMALSAAAGLSYMQPLFYLHRLGRLPCTQTASGKWSWPQTVTSPLLYKWLLRL